MKTAIACVVASSLLLAAGCKTPAGTTPDEKRASIMQMHDQSLRDLYRLDPTARSVVEDAPGYAVFSNIATKILLFGGGNGYGVVVNNATGEKTYMRMAEVGVGVGMGIRDFRAVFVFADRDVMHDFVTHGWQIGGDASANAKLEETGAAADASADLARIRVYQFTENGLALEATVRGTKYWRDSSLN